MEGSKISLIGWGMRKGGEDMRAREREGRTVSQMVTWESAGQPVQPQYCSSPKDLTMIGLSNVPVGDALASRRLIQQCLSSCFDIREPKLRNLS